MGGEGEEGGRRREGLSRACGISRVGWGDSGVVYLVGGILGYVVNLFGLSRVFSFYRGRRVWRGSWNLAWRVGVWLRFGEIFLEVVGSCERI